jgi:hypothetical protein
VKKKNKGKGKDKGKNKEKKISLGEFQDSVAENITTSTAPNIAGIQNPPVNFHLQPMSDIDIDTDLDYPDPLVSPSPASSTRRAFLAQPATSTPRDQVHPPIDTWTPPRPLSKQPSATRYVAPLGDTVGPTARLARPRPHQESDSEDGDDASDIEDSIMLINLQAATNRTSQNNEPRHTYA